METNKITRDQIIRETLERYEGYPERRSFNGYNVLGKEKCCYFDGKGNSCALGHYLDIDNPIVKEMQSRIDFEMNRYGACELDEILSEGLDSILKEEYRGWDAEFWSDLQSLHDVQEFWNKNTGLLTGQGRLYYEGLLQMYGDVKKNFVE